MKIKAKIGLGTLESNLTKTRLIPFGFLANF
jgi:hypothetical protein